ncbi:MAG: hypothetical protein ABI411_13795 [Tahibacter sp.]
MQITQPVRVVRSHTQHLVAEPSRVFPLLCPVREADWIDGWDPLCVITESGVAEADCVFVTAAEPHDAIWIITRHEPESGFVEMLKVTPQVTVCRLSIQLNATVAGCDATITYRHTSLGPAGDAAVAAFTQAYYDQFMRDWEARINHYLVHGSLLPAER